MYIVFTTNEYYYMYYKTKWRALQLAPTTRQLVPRSITTVMRIADLNTIFNQFLIVQDIGNLISSFFFDVVSTAKRVSFFLCAHEFSFKQSLLSKETTYPCKLENIRFTKEFIQTIYSNLLCKLYNLLKT